MNEIESLLAEYKEIKSNMKNKLSESFKSYIKTYFDKNPEIKTIFWNQYTPYFNDGDTCTFSVYDAYETNCEDTSQLSSWGEYEGEDENVTVDYCSEIGSVICSNEMEEVMYDMFGDHVRVFCTRDGFEVQELSHD